MFYVWVNCFGIIAPVQAWSFANSLFDTRQAKRLFGLIGAGASLGAITGGVLARFLVGPVGGTVNMLLVLAIAHRVGGGDRVVRQREHPPARSSRRSAARAASRLRDAMRRSRAARICG